MSTIYMSQLPATLPLMEGDQDQGLYPAFHRAKEPPILFPFMIDSAVEHQGQSYGDQGLRRQQVLGESNQQFNDHMMMGGSDVFLAPSPFRPTIQSIGSDMIQRSSYDLYDIENNNKHANGSTSKWMSTPPVKMKIIRKGAATDPEGGAVRKPRRRAQAHQDESQLQQQQQALGVVRVCSDCNTTKTPLWRSGPCGPKSLCNACGIRQRKARRAMAAAANGGAAAAPARSVVSTSAAPVNNKPSKKEKRAADIDRSLPFKKRCKMVDHAAAVAATKPTAGEVVAAAPKKDQDHVVAAAAAAAATAPAQSPISKQAASVASPAFFHGLPRDEITDAAMLLMTLSCGLVRS
uniref:GATA-type domain-containing protein n=1 Tax=Oryza punctata TaxID=4537 RepID=A0A0E0JXE7_ORYPU